MRPSRLHLSLWALSLASAGTLLWACGSDDVSQPAAHFSTTGATSSGQGGSSSTASGDGGLFDFDGGPTGTGGAGTGGEGGACAVTEVAAETVPANILFVIDRSGSMTCNPPPLQTSQGCELNPIQLDPAEPSKWDIVKDALVTAVDALPATTNVGVTFFSDDDYCGVSQAPDVALGPAGALQTLAISAAADALEPKGATPIVGSVTLGYAHMFYDVLNPGNDFVVLLTDGAETCAPDLMDKMIGQTVPDALSVGIRTFVIGAPGSEGARAFLSQMAYAGGTARDPACVHDPGPADTGDCHFDMTIPGLDFATELGKALQKINTQAISCEIAVPASVGVDVDYDKVNVSYIPGPGEPGETVPQDNAPCDNGSNGWQYSADKTKILLCGLSCDIIKNDPDGKVSIALGCATQVAN